MFSNILRYDFIKMLLIIFFQECYKYLLLPLINTYKFPSSSCTHMSSNKNVKNLFNEIVYVCVYVYARARTCMYICMHMCVCVFIYHVYTRVRACTHAHTRTHMYIYIRDHNNNDYITAAIVHSTSKIQIRR